MMLVAFASNPVRFSVSMLPKGKTVTAEHMVKRFNSLKQNKITFKELTLQMDNARLHAAGRTMAYLTNNGVNRLSQSPYSPDLNLCDRWLFTRLQEHCRKVQYLSGDEALDDVQRFLRGLPETTILREVEKLVEHCRAIINEAGGYVTS